MTALIVATTPWEADASTTTTSAAQDAGLRDSELVDALRDAGVLERFYATSPHHRAVTTMTLAGSGDFELARATLIADARALAESRSEEIKLLIAIDEIEGAIGILDGVARELRSRNVSGLGELQPEEAALLRKAFLQARETGSHDSLRDARVTLEQLWARVGEELANAQRRSRGKQDQPVATLTDVLAQIEALYGQLAELRASASVTTAAEEALLDRITVAMGDVHRFRPRARTAVDGWPAVTLDAYLRAGEHGIDGCSVDWRLLAGIGRIESFHGTIGDSEVGSTGLVAPEVLGPLLDGGQTERDAVAAAAAEEAERALAAAEEAARLAAEEAERRRLLYGPPPTPTPTPTPLFPEPTATPDPDSEAEEAEEEGNGFAVIEDTDDGEIDGNDAWDRAVGPMQFIPGTWALWESDGNGDEIADPHNLYDAAYSAARYLCHLERRNGPSPWVFVLGYNASDTYVSNVIATATRLEVYDVGSAVEAS
ncbi:MAG: hypothetical protein AAF567_08065 [Actinomycetota bacterium]